MKYLIIFLLFVQTSSFAQTYNWVSYAGGNGDDNGEYIKTDSNGNSYITGYFSNTATFGSGNLTSVSAYDMYLTKIDAAGNFKWRKSIGTTGTDNGNAIDFDNKGYIYVAGFMNGNIVAKFDTLGNLLKTIPVTAGVYTTGISIFKNQIYLTGSFPSTKTFGSTTITAIGQSDIFVACYDTIGTLNWIRQIGGPSLINEANEITTDAKGNCYITGKSNNNIITAKYDKAGTLQWQKTTTGGTSSNIGWSIAVDSAYNSYITGYAYALDFDTKSLTGSGIFVTKYDPNGNARWAKRVAQNPLDCYAIRFDHEGYFYLTGRYVVASTFGSTTLSSNGRNSAFIAKYDTSGTNIWADKAWASSGGIVSNSISFDKYNNVYFTGYFGDYSTNPYTATFGNLTTGSYGYQDIFVTKIISNSVPTGLFSPANNGEHISLYPNPSTGKVTLNGLQDGESNITLYDSHGIPVRNYHTEGNEADLSIIGFNSGMYLLQIEHRGKLYSKQLVIY